MKTALIALATATMSLAVATPSFAGDRIVNCYVESDGKVDFRGKCRFAGKPNGSFSLENVDTRRPFMRHVLILQVSVMRPGVAEVRGLTPAGINSRWGDVRRSSRQPACWVGDGIKICAS